MERVSDIKKVNKLSRMIYKKTVEPSTRTNKKYMIMNDENKLVHFGDLRYEDYTKHQDEDRRNNFRKRNWKWANADKYSPAYLSYHLLW